MKKIFLPLLHLIYQHLCYLNSQSKKSSRRAYERGKILTKIKIYLYERNASEGKIGEDYLIRWSIMKISKQKQ